MNLPEQEYHDYPAWSYSIIAKYARDGFGSLPTLHDKMAPTPAMEFEALFDSILTRGKKTLDYYAVSDVSVPDAERKVLDALADNCTCPSFHDISEAEVIATADSVRYQPNWKAATRYEKISKYSEYYDMVKSGKKMVSQKDWNDAVEMAKVFRTDPYLKTVFGTKNTDEVEYLYQTQFLADWETERHGTVVLKCMFDLLVVNHKDKTIQPVDLKTSAIPGFDFADHFVKMRYDIQGDLYATILSLVIDSMPEYKDYVILQFLFTDISRSDKVAVTYHIDLSNGFSFTRDGKTYSYRRWNELLEEILDYEQTNAKVPSYITTEGPNDLIAILERR